MMALLSAQSCVPQPLRIGVNGSNRHLRGISKPPYPHAGVSVRVAGGRHRINAFFNPPDGPIVQQALKVDLVADYYDTGDNLKYGLPMTFTVTMLAWGALQYRDELAAVGESENVRHTIKWGTDYFIKASATKNELWVKVGDPIVDHNYWENPEWMDTPRTFYKIDTSIHETEIAAETAAALATSSIVFAAIDKTYSILLLKRAILVDYILGNNPACMSFMVGFGEKYPQQAHQQVQLWEVPIGMMGLRIAGKIRRSFSPQRISLLTSSEFSLTSTETAWNH